MNLLIRVFLRRGRHPSRTGTTCFCLLAAMIAFPLFANQSRPNIVFILADDLGYGDLSLHGAPDIRTPHLDRLAGQGVHLTNCYSNESVCSPTRAAFMTGRYQQRIGLDWAVPYAVPKEGLPAQEISIAKMIRNAGYATYMSGKWHLGYDPDMRPLSHGFDRWYGLLGGNINYVAHKDRNGLLDWYLDDKPNHDAGYATDLIADRAIAFINEAKGKPFFLYVPFNAPHFPYQGPTDGAELPKWETGTRERNYVPMVERLDNAIGRILTTLDELKLADNTLVVFTSDNGGHFLSRNAPFRSKKGTCWEGGIHVPGIARLPGVIPAGSTSKQVVLTMDWAATFVRLAGGSAPADRPFDGIDVLPMLSGKAPVTSRQVFWRRTLDPYRGSVKPQLAVRDGDWKLVVDAEGAGLFDLSRDVGEQKDLAGQHPDRVSALRKLLRGWLSDINPPLYDQRPAKAKGARPLLP